MDVFLAGTGWIYGSAAVMVIALVCAVVAMVGVAGFPKSLKQIGMWFISIGWLVLFVRLLIPILNNVNPDLSPAGQIATALLGAGQIFYILGDMK